MSAQASPNDVEAVLSSRYWLTDKGYAVLAAIEAQDDEAEPT